jgi:hypothetical protein
MEFELLVPEDARLRARISQRSNVVDDSDDDSDDVRVAPIADAPEIIIISSDDSDDDSGADAGSVCN